MKVYMHKDKIYCHQVSKQDNEYDMAISPYIVLKDGQPLYAFVSQNEAYKYCNAFNSDEHTYKAKPFLFYDKNDLTEN